MVQRLLLALTVQPLEALVLGALWELGQAGILIILAVLAVTVVVAEGQRP
jgi:hypothetical protein